MYKLNLQGKFKSKVYNVSNNQNKIYKIQTYPLTYQIHMTFSANPQVTTALVIFLIANILMNFFWKESLFKLGLNIIYSIQQWHNLPLDVFFYLVTVLIDPFVVMLTTFTLIIVVKNKYRAFVTVMFILFNTYLAGLLKAFYADPRPYWAHDKISSIGLYCPQEYGNPSGHSWFSIVIAFVLIIDYWGLGPHKRYMYGAIALMVLVPMSRMYLGAHSLNQVLQGLTLGLAMIYLYKFSGLKAQIQSFLKNFNSQPKLRWKKIILLMHILYLFSFFINQADINPYHKPIPQQWVKNIKSKCNKQVDTNHLNFMMLMVNSLLVNLATGIGLGFEELIKSQKGRIYLGGRWVVNQQRYSLIWAYLGFYLVQLAHFVVGLLPVILAVWLFDSYHSVLFIFGNIGAVISGYIYTSRTFLTLFNLELIREEIL